MLRADSLVLSSVLLLASMSGGPVCERGDELTGHSLVGRFLASALGHDARGTIADLLETSLSSSLVTMLSSSVLGVSAISSKGQASSPP
jgi:hypothetical protein